MNVREQLDLAGFVLTEMRLLIEMEKREILPRGIRNNNPFNIKDSATHWQGEKLQGFDPVYEEFTNAPDGIRAGFKVLLAYRNKHGLHTIRKVINRFAPVTENNVESYIKSVCERSMLTPDIVLLGIEWLQLADAMIVHENGYNPYCTALMVREWYEVFGGV